MNANTYGNIRVSTLDQKEDRQLAAMEGLSIPEKTFLWKSNPAKILTVRSIKSCSAG